MVDRQEQTLRLCREHSVLGSYDAALVYMDDMLRSVDKQLASCRRAVSASSSKARDARNLADSLTHGAPRRPQCGPRLPTARS